MSMEYGMNNIDKGILKYWKKSFSKCHFFYHKSHLACHEIQHGPPKWQSSHLWLAGFWILSTVFYSEINTKWWKKYSNQMIINYGVLQPHKIFIVVPRMLFQSLLYCSKSCTSLHFKTLKHLKFAPTCFSSLWNHPQGVHGCTSLGYWIGMLIYICYKECRFVAVCQFIPSRVHVRACVRACVWVPIWSRHRYGL